MLGPVEVLECRWMMMCVRGNTVYSMAKVCHYQNYDQVISSLSLNFGLVFACKMLNP